MSISFSTPVPRMCVLYHNFCLYVVSCYLKPNYHDLKWLNSCVNMTGVVQWLRLALSKGPNWVSVFSPLHLRTETDPVFETSCFYSLECRTMEKVQKRSNSVCYTPSSEPFRIYLQGWCHTESMRGLKWAYCFNPWCNINMEHWYRTTLNLCKKAALVPLFRHIFLVDGLVRLVSHSHATTTGTFQRHAYAGSRCCVSFVT
jgi:hypothetical protein